MLEQLRGILRALSMMAEVVGKAMVIEAIDGAQVAVAMTRLDEIWDQLFPAEQQRIARLLVEIVIISREDMEVRLRPNGIEKLAIELRPAVLEEAAA